MSGIDFVTSRLKFFPHPQMLMWCVRWCEACNVLGSKYLSTEQSCPNVGPLLATFCRFSWASVQPDSLPLWKLLEFSFHDVLMFQASDLHVLLVSNWFQVSVSALALRHRSTMWEQLLGHRLDFMTLCLLWLSEKVSDLVPLRFTGGGTHNVCGRDFWHEDRWVFAHKVAKTYKTYLKLCWKFLKFLKFGCGRTSVWIALNWASVKRACSSVIVRGLEQWGGLYLVYACLGPKNSFHFGMLQSAFASEGKGIPFWRTLANWPRAHAMLYGGNASQQHLQYFVMLYAMFFDSAYTTMSHFWKTVEHEAWLVASCRLVYLAVTAFKRPRYIRFWAMWSKWSSAELEPFWFKTYQVSVKGISKLFCKDSRHVLGVLELNPQSSRYLVWKCLTLVRMRSSQG